MSEEMVEEKVNAEGDSEARVGRGDCQAPSPAGRDQETGAGARDGDGESLEVVTPAPHLGLTRDETNWAALAHASILLTLLLGVVTGGIAVFLGPIVPALIWYAYREKSEYVTEQARQATIFQVAGLLGLLALAVVGAILVVVGWAVSAVLVIVLIGLLLLVVMADRDPALGRGTRRAAHRAGRLWLLCGPRSLQWPPLPLLVGRGRDRPLPGTDLT